uniref:Uncharacterized protein n=2 Tax=Octopus bimaculoides TaxID=37653 RepID=A0A0L8HVY2_OCTBM
MAPLDVHRVTSASRGHAVDLTDTSSFSGSSQSRSTASAKMKQVQLPPILPSPLFVEAPQGCGQPQDSNHQSHHHHRRHHHHRHHYHGNNQKQVHEVEKSAGWGCGRRRNMQK